MRSLGDQFSQTKIFNNGDYLNLGLTPAKGLALARMVGHITYLSDDILGEKFGKGH